MDLLNVYVQVMQYTNISQGNNILAVTTSYHNQLCFNSTELFLLQSVMVLALLYIQEVLSSSLSLEMRYPDRIFVGFLSSSRQILR